MPPLHPILKGSSDLFRQNQIADAGSGQVLGLPLDMGILALAKGRMDALEVSAPTDLPSWLGAVLYLMALMFCTAAMFPVV